MGKSKDKQKISNERRISQKLQKNNKKRSKNKIPKDELSKLR